jgi:hypothetical protein
MARLLKIMRASRALGSGAMRFNLSTQSAIDRDFNYQLGRL